MISVQGSGGGGEKITIGGIEIGGELKLTAKCQWVGEETPRIDYDLTGMRGFTYEGLIHIAYGTTHKKLVNDVWVDDVSLPKAISAFCSSEDYAFGFVDGDIYRFDGNEWTLILTLSGSSGIVGNIVHDNGKLYCCRGANAYVISLSDLSYEQIPAMVFTEVNKYKYNPLSFKVFVRNGELHGTYIYYKGYYSNERWPTDIMKYDKTSGAWVTVGSITQWRGLRTALSVENNIAYMFTGLNMCIFDGVTTKCIYSPCEIGLDMFHLNGVIHSIGSFTKYFGDSSNSNMSIVAVNNLMSYKKVLCLEV